MAARASAIGGAPAPSALEPFRAYVERRLADDPHLDATVLLRELRPLGFERSYPTLTRELRRLELRPACEVCKRGGHRLTVELEHEPGEELQLDWLELPETPWGEPAHVLVGALSHSGRIRAVLSEGEDFAQLVAALDGVLRRLGGTARCWRTDRMATIVEPGSGRLRAEAAELAKHYGVTIAVCPPRRAQRKGVVEAAIRYLQRSWWRTAEVADAGGGAGLARPLVRRGRRPAPPRPRSRSRQRRRRSRCCRCRRSPIRPSCGSSGSSRRARWSRSRATATASRRAWPGRR